MLCDSVSRGVPGLVRAAVVGTEVVVGEAVVAGTAAVVETTLDDATVVDETIVVAVRATVELVVCDVDDVSASAACTEVVDTDASCAASFTGSEATTVDCVVAPASASPLVSAGGAAQADTDAATVNIDTSNERLRFALLRPSPSLVPLSVMVRRGWLVGSLLMFALVGCGGSRESVPSGASFIMSEDYALPVVEHDKPVLPTRTTGADGIPVEVTDVSRIIVLNQAIAEIVVSLGLRESIIGRDATTTIASLADVTKVSNGHDISAESVLSLRPTVVIGDTRTGPAEVLEQLRGAGVAVVIAPEVWTLSALPSRVRMIADALGVTTAGEKLVALSEDAVAKALDGVGRYASVPRVAFLYVRGTASVYLLGGSGSGADELIAAAGAVDVGALNGLAAFTPLTAEAIVQADPDVLLVMTRGLDSVGGVDGLLALPGVSSTRAAAARAVIAVDDDLLLSFGPRTGALISRLAELLHTYSSDA